jgi:hypothetical protein
MRAMESRVIHGLSEEGERRRSLTPLFLARARSVVEVPIRHDPAKSGSHYSLLTLTGIAVDFFLGSAKRPFLSALLLPAGAAVCAAVVFAAALLAGSVPVALGTLIVLVGAVVAALVAFVGDYVQRVYDVAQGRPLYRVREEDAPHHVAPVSVEKKARLG